MTDERINAMFVVMIDLLNANLVMADAFIDHIDSIACDSQEDRKKAALHRDRRIRWSNEYTDHARQIARDFGLIPPEDEDEDE